MKFNSAQANKLIKKLNEEYNNILEKESKTSTFHVAMGENPENLRPKYDYEGTKEKIANIEKQIRTVKHALNIFNTTHLVPGFDMTIDEILVYIPQLTKQKVKLQEMRNRSEKERVTERFFNTVDYLYTNYDMDKIEADYQIVSDELARAQLALDKINNGETIEIDI